MNKAHRIVWSESRGAFIVAHEFAATSGKRSSTKSVIAQSLAVAALVATSAPALAQTVYLGTGQSYSNPTGTTVQGTSGSPGIAVFGAKAGSITNSGTIASALTAGESNLLFGVFVGTAGGLSGGITNSGTVSLITGQNIGINIVSNSTVANIVNAGTITGNTISGITIAGGSLGTVFNSGTTSLIQGGTVGIAVMSGATAAGITNAGTISGGQTGIYVTGAGTSLAGINNTGTSSTISGGVYGISVESGAKVGAITNQGHIVGDTAGIFVQNGSSVTAISNSGSISANSNGVLVRGTAATVGSITNNGSILGSTNNGVALESRATVTGAISNSGMIYGEATGVYVEGSSTLGSLVNSGTITTAGNNRGAGVAVSSGAVVGSIQNQTGGVITGGTSGIRLVGGAVVGSISNAGSISSASTGIQVYKANTSSSGALGSTVTGSISNSGVIIGANTGIRIHSNSTVGSIINSGTISGASGVEIYQDSGLVSGLTNSGTIQGTGYVGILLATSTLTGGLTNSGMISGVQNGIALVSASTLAGGLTNSGTIMSNVLNQNTASAILVGSGSVITGGIHNLAGGVISGASGIGIYDSSVDSITNAGLISGTFSGISVYDSTLSGGIHNLSGGTISATTIGMYIDSRSTISGGITNSGTIYADYGIGVFGATVSGGISNLAGGVISGASGIYGILVEDGTVDSISNAGTISSHGTVTSGGHYGIDVTASRVGQIANSGVITADGVGIGIFASTVAGVQNSGTIIGGQSGVAVGNNTTVTGAIANSGLISSSAGNALVLYSNATVAGGISNSGTLSGAQNGIAIFSGSQVAGAINNLAGGSIIGTSVAGVLLASASTVTGGILNAGTITGATSGILLASGSQVAGAINNQAGASISGTSGAGVMVNASTVTGGVINAGTIKGASVGLDVIDAATVSGLINSGVISGGTYSVYADATSSLGPITIAGRNTGSFVGDVYALNSAVTVASGTFTGTNAFNVQSFDVAQGALMNLGAMVSTAGETNGVTTSQGFTNEGTVSVGRSSGLITGSYTQAASGAFGVGVASKTDHGVLAVNGAANLSPDANIIVDIAANNTLTNKETITGVLTSSDLTASTFKVTDNSDLISFTGFVDGNNVDLVTKFNALVLPDVLANYNSNAVGAAKVLDQIILGSNGVGPFTGVINDIAKLQSTRQVSDAASQTLPLLSGDVNVATYAALSQMNQVVQSRVDGNYGMSAGSPYMLDQNAWVKPIGSWANAADQNGAPGFSSTAEGVALGGDAAITNAARVGLAFAYANVDVSGNSHAAPNDDRINMYQLMGYGSYAIDPRTEVNAQLDGGINTNDGHRSLSYFGSSATSSFNSSDAHFGLGIARSLPLSDTTIFTPQVRVDYTWISTDDYSEGGAGPLNLNVKSTSFESLLTQINGKLTQKINDNLTIFGNLGIGYDSLAHNNSSVVAAFAGAPGLSFSTEGVGLSPRALLGGIGIVSTPHGNAPELSFRYDVQQRDGFADQSVSFKARWAF